MTNAPAISVCIANYNGRDVIEQCIDSVLGQVGDFTLEIIVHDDCSTDGSGELIESRYPQAKLIRSTSNVGFCVSNNRMVAQAQGEYLLLLNNDAALFPDALETLYEAAQSLGQPAILSLPQYDDETGALIDNGCLLDPFLNPVPNLDPTRQDVGMVIGACMWIPKVLWEEFVGFPEWFGSIGEDLYLCCWARLAGNPVRALARSGYRHKVGQSFGGGRPRDGHLLTTFRRRALSERNKTFVMVMTYPTPFMELMLPLHLLLLVVEGVLLSIFHRRIALLTKVYLPVFPALVSQRKSLLFGRRVAMNRCRSVESDFFSVLDPLPYKLRMLRRHGLPRVQ